MSSVATTQAVVSPRAEIERFLAMVYASLDAQVRLAPIGNDFHDIAVFARAAGYMFSGDDLAGYVAEQLEARLDAEQKRARAAAFARPGKGPTLSDRDHPGCLEIPAAKSAGTLDRAPVFAGDIVVVRGSKAFATLAQHLRDALMAALQDADPTTAHLRLDEETCHARIQQMDQALADDPALPRLVAEFARSLGWPLGGTGYFGPFVRHNLPSTTGGAAGYFSKVKVHYTSRLGERDGAAGLLNAHRDTWFGAPFHQVNIWAPLYAYPPGSGIVLVPSLFSRSLSNNTAGYDLWRAALGYAMGPVCLEEVDPARLVPVELQDGELMVFSANHFHGTGPNTGAFSRISMELRLVCEEDHTRDLRAPNVDFHGIGELSLFRPLPVAEALLA